MSRAPLDGAERLHGAGPAEGAPGEGGREGGSSVRRPGPRWNSRRVFVTGGAPPQVSLVSEI